MVDINLLMEEFYDILSSGYGSELDEFHIRELTKLVKDLTKEQKKEVWEYYSSNTDDLDDYEVANEEKEFVKELCEVE